MKTENIYIRVSGHLEKKRDIYQVILNWKDITGKRCRKSISTRLPAKGNKKRAEDILNDKRSKLECELNRKFKTVNAQQILFADFLEGWLDFVKTDLKPTTLGNHQNTVRRIIGPYFRERQISLANLTSDAILDFYAFKTSHVKATTIHKYHNLLSRALKYAVEKELIEYSPMSKVKRPKPERFVGKFLRESEIKQLLEAAKGHKLEIGIILGAYYGLRRSEIVGLRWESIDFDKNTITIEHSVTVAKVDGQKRIIESDTLKTKSGYRTLPLIQEFRNKLLSLKQEQERYRKLCGNSYNKTESKYIYIDPLGNRIKPDYLTAEFPLFMEKNGFRRIRFHDLRHSCASLLLANGVSLKQIQEWLGHSSYKITADIYSHLDFSSKIETANVLARINTDM